MTFYEAVKNNNLVKINFVPSCGNLYATNLLEVLICSLNELFGDF
jgi:hypothetical protein